MCWSPVPRLRQDTSLYAAVSEIKNDEDKIITIEDPVEYQIKGITQIPVNEKKGLTFARVCAPSCGTTRQDHGGRDPRPGDRANRHQRASPATWFSPPCTQQCL